MVKDYCSNENIREFHIETHSEQWFKFRSVGIPEYEGGIGASEIGKVCGHDIYPPCLAQVYHHKVGTELPEQFDNERMLAGRMAEPLLIDIACLWDGTLESYVGKIEKYLELGRPAHMRLRDIVRIRSYIVNDKYPFLFNSLDALIPSGSFSLRDGVVLQLPAPLELKTISEMAAKQWIGGVPRKYVYQINQQMLGLESDYGEIAIRKDGTYFNIHTFERNDAICEEILTKGERFWEERVLPGREYFKAYKEAVRLGDKAVANKAMERIFQFEPGPDGTPAYREWMTEKARKASEGRDQEVAKADMVIYGTAREYHGVREVKKLIDTLNEALKGDLLRYMRDNKVRFVSFGEEGKAQITNGGAIKVDLNVDLSQEAQDIMKSFNLSRFN